MSHSSGRQSLEHSETSLSRQSLQLLEMSSSRQSLEHLETSLGRHRLDWSLWIRPTPQVSRV
jgi:hypothetical protein